MAVFSLRHFFKKKTRQNTLFILVAKLWYTNANLPGLTPIGPPMWQSEADAKLTLPASPATAVGQLTITLANWRYCTVLKSGKLRDKL